MKEGANRFLKGDMKMLAYFRKSPVAPSSTSKMVLVRPGASITTVTDDALRLLATTELYVIKTTQAGVSGCAFGIGEASMRANW